MKRADIDENLRVFQNFQNHLTTFARHATSVGERVAAGLLLVLERDLYYAWLDWRAQVQADDEVPPVPAKKGAKEEKCRHDFRDANGLESDTCLLCKSKKSPRGRKRTQTVLAPPVMRSRVKGLGPCHSNDGEHKMQADPKNLRCEACGAVAFCVPNAG